MPRRRKNTCNRTRTEHDEYMFRLNGRNSISKTKKKRTKKNKYYWSFIVEYCRDRLIVLLDIFNTTARMLLLLCCVYVYGKKLMPEADLHAILKHLSRLRYYIFIWKWMNEWMNKMISCIFDVFTFQFIEIIILKNNASTNATFI